MSARAHIRIAEPDTFFQLPEAQRGIYVGGGGSVAIARVIGVSRMTELMLTGRRMSAEQAERAGMIHELVESGQATARALEVAESVAKNSPMVNYMITQALHADRRHVERRRRFCGKPGRWDYFMRAMMPKREYPRLPQPQSSAELSGPSVE